MIQIRSDGGAC